MRESYKQQRHEDDLNQPLSVQPWGRDGDKRRFWLAEGQDDTHFRLYRESNPVLKHITWRSVAGTIDELKEVANKLGEEDTQASRRLRDRILAAIPRFEASEDVSALPYKETTASTNSNNFFQKRKRRDYRNARKAQFTRPAELGFSIYEGRTRGKRIKYTFSDEEGAASDTASTRRSNRHSGISTPAEPAGPTFTASGRQVRSRVTMLSGQHVDGGQTAAEITQHVNDEEGQPVTYGRGQRSAGRSTRVRNYNRNFKSYDGTDEDSAAPSSGEEWKGGDDDADADDQMLENAGEEDLEMSDDEVNAAVDEDGDQENEEKRSSLVVSLKYQREVSPRPSVNGLQQREDPPTNGVQGPILASSSDVQGQQAQHQIQNFTLRPGSHSQEAKPVMQDYDGDLKPTSSPIKEIFQTPGPARYSRPLADAPSA